ncbi:hypothetical protein [Klebsiella aerogenes]|uniref:hypothetical protein n=1 Tax=Klebsiella aerogenes TaxID=548 RepID=UPI00138E0008|nr:hypothetical protein [Klebsiella aerogenes]EKW3260570.1 hypothetical protein [Klebsiella aerogenes]EKZ3167214.1 hypothetical protein [Klebsiella aerogenes]ELS5745802.1 hypothetical protein [Klebsiella aerogenes]MBK0634818.1 hypothetical protein [Klebsiella aerogenes]MCB8474688.1 hypothetical protein [Klebsiella aerogenes]
MLQELRTSPSALTGLSPGKCGLTSRRGSAAARQAVHQDNDAQALMEVGTGNSRFVSVRYGFTACDRVAGVAVRRAGETKKWRSARHSRVNDS